MFIRYCQGNYLHQMLLYIFIYLSSLSFKFHLEKVWHSHLNPCNKAPTLAVTILNYLFTHFNACYYINIYLINVRQNGFKCVLLDESKDCNQYIPKLSTLLKSTSIKSSKFQQTEKLEFKMFVYTLTSKISTPVLIIALI